MLSLHSCPLDIPGKRYTGGMNVYVRQLARGLGRKGIKVDIFTAGHRSAAEESRWRGSNVRLIHLPVNCHEDRLELPPYLPDVAVAIDRFASEQAISYNVVHSHYWMSGLVGAQLASRWKAPHVVMLHTSARAKNFHLRDNTESELRDRAEENVLRSADLIVASTMSESFDLAWLYPVDPSRITIIPCGVDLETFRPHPKAEARGALGLNGGPVVLYVGRIERGKGIDLLVRGMAISREKDSRLIIIGGDESEQKEMARLQSMVNRFGLKDRVSFCGAMAHERLPLCYSAADICVLPSRYETFGMVAIEAMACGTPVIGSRVGVMQRIIEHGRNGLLLDELSSTTLARAQQMLLQDENLRQKMSRAARESVQDYTWQRVTREVMAAYRRVSKSNQHKPGWN